MKYILLSVLSILLMSYQCESELEENYVDQEIIFIKIYENHAWGHSFGGWLIDDAGNVRAFDLRQMSEMDWAPFDEEGYISGRDLLKNSQLCFKTWFTVDNSDLYYNYSLIEGASRGILTEGTSMGADMGQNTFYALKYFPEHRKYKAVVLNSYGDWIIENTSREAFKITKWLTGIDNQVQELSRL